MLTLSSARLEALRNELQARGQRKSVVLPSASPKIIEAMGIVEEFGPMCEALYLVMAADRRVLNVEREVARGAMAVLSDGRVRTVHMEAMFDAAARRSAEEGEQARVHAVIEALHDDAARAKTTVLLCAAIALADGRVTVEEHEMLNVLANGLDMGTVDADELLAELVDELKS